MTAQPGGTPHMTDLRDTRCGVILLIRSEEAQLIGTVYGGIGSFRARTVLTSSRDHIRTAITV